MIKFVKSNTDTGRCVSSSEVVEEAEKLRWLQQAWKDGIDSGDYRPLDIEAIKAEGRS